MTSDANLERFVAERRRVIRGSILCVKLEASVAWEVTHMSSFAYSKEDGCCGGGTSERGGGMNMKDFTMKRICFSDFFNIGYE